MILNHAHCYLHYASVARTSGAIIMKLTYGIEVQEKNDPFVELIEHANDNFSLATKPGISHILK